jgi:tetratricopeptide (TPR) repeat protein
MRAVNGQGIMRRNVFGWVAAALWLVGAHATAQEAPDGVPAEEDATEGGDREVLDRDESAVAATGDDAARGHFRVGGILYDEGRFRDAAEEFRKAYELSDRPELLYNMYIAYRDAGLTQEAVAALRGYLEQVDEVPNRRKLEVRLAAMEETLQDRSAEEAATAGRAESSRTEELELHEEVAPERSLLPWIVAGIGAGLVVVGSVTGLMALSRTSDIEDACPGGQCPADYPLERERDRARRFALATDVLLPLGALAVGTGLLLFFLKKRNDAAPRPPVEANASCGPGGCAGELRMRF